MKTLIFSFLILASSLAYADYTPQWNPAWDNDGTKQQQEHNKNNDDGWGHNHVKSPAQGDYDWDQHADRGDMHWN